MTWKLLRILARRLTVSSRRTPARRLQRSFQPLLELLEKRELLDGTPTTTWLSTMSNPATAGQSVSFSADVRPTSGSGNPTGSVVFQDGDTVLARVDLAPGMMGPRATYTTSSLAPGTHALKALYQGDTTYDTSTGNLTETVNLVTTWTSLGADTNPAQEGQGVTFTAQVSSSNGSSGPAPDGTVTFKDNGTVLQAVTVSAGGMGAQATYATSNLSVGTHNITAEYSGSGSFAGSMGSWSETINPASGGSSSTMTSLWSSINPAQQGQAVTFTASVSSMMGGGTPTGSVTFLDGNNPLDTVTLTSGAQASCTTAGLSAGSHSISASYSGDATHAASTAMPITETINPPSNRPPSLTNPGSQSSAEGGVVSLQIHASDPDNDSLSYSANGLPAGLTIDTQSGLITGTVGYNAAEINNGSYSVTVSAGDGHGGSDSMTFFWTVTDTNRAPLAAADSARTLPGTAVTIPVLANDTDPDGDALTVSSFTAPANGQLTLNADNTVTYTPAPNFQGTDLFSYTVSDGHGGSASANVSVTVTPVVHWVASGGGSWDNPSNWDIGEVPGSTADVYIGVPGLASIGASGSVSVHSLHSTDWLSVAGSLSMAADSQVGAPLTVGGDLDVQAGAHVLLSGGATVSGGMNVAAGATLELGAGFNTQDSIQGGNVAGAVQVDTGLTLLLQGTTTVSGTITTQAGGSTQFIGGQATLTDGAAFSGDGKTILQGATLTVAGTTSASNLELDQGAVLNGSGTLQVTGTLTWNGGTMAGTGTTQIEQDALLDIAGWDAKVLDGWTLDNTGTVDWSGADLQASDGAVIENEIEATFNMQGDVSLRDNTGDSVFNNDGNLLKSAGNGDSVLATKFNTTGTVTVAMATLTFIGGGNLGGRFHVTDTGAVVEFTQGSYLAGNVTIDGAGLTRIGPADAGLLALGAPAPAMPGATDYEVAEGKTQTEKTDTEITTGIGGTGTFVQASGTLTWKAGTMKDAGTTRIDAGAQMVLATGNQKTVDGRLIENHGTVDWRRGSLELDGGTPDDPVFVNYQDFNMQGDLEMINTAGNVSIFTNKGVFAKTGGDVRGHTMAEITNIVFNNEGTVQVNTGGLRFTRMRGTNTGTFEAGPNTWVYFDAVDCLFDPNRDDTSGAMLVGTGEYDIEEDAIFHIQENSWVTADNIRLDGGAVTGNGGGDFEARNCIFAAGRMGGGGLTVDIERGDILTIDQGSQPVTFNESNVINHGLIMWFGEDVELNGATIDTDGGKFEDKGGHDLLQGLIPGHFIVKNGGTYVKEVNESGAATTIKVPFENDGGNAVVNGTLIVTDVLAQSAGQTTITGELEFTTGAFPVAGGNFVLDGGMITAPNKQLQIEPGATLTGYGTITADVYNEGHLSVTAGNLTIEGKLVETTGLGFPTAMILLNGNILSVADTVDLQQGQLWLGGGTLATGDELSIHLGAICGGSGTITGNVTDAGQLRLVANDDTDAPATISIQGDFVQPETGTVRVFLSAFCPGGGSQFTVTGVTRLRGQLEIQLVSGFQPLPGNSFDILQCNSIIAGSFGFVPPYWSLLQDETSINITFTAPQ